MAAQREPAADPCTPSGAVCRGAGDAGHFVRLARPLPHPAGCARFPGPACAHQQRGRGGHPGAGCTNQHLAGHHHLDPLPPGCAHPHHAEPLSPELWLHAHVHGALGRWSAALAAGGAGAVGLCGAARALHTLLLCAPLVSAHVGADRDAACRQCHGLWLWAHLAARWALGFALTRARRSKTAVLPAAGQRRRAAFCAGQRWPGHECAVREPGQSVGDGACAGRCCHCQPPGAGRGRCRPPGFGCPGLYVVDASAIPANVGVNPSLTVTALAERFAMRFPHR